jgi:hypothetical protein
MKRQMATHPRQLDDPPGSVLCPRQLAMRRQSTRRRQRATYSRQLDDPPGLVPCPRQLVLRRLWATYPRQLDDPPGTVLCQRQLALRSMPSKEDISGNTNNKVNNINHDIIAELSGCDDIEGVLGATFISSMARWVGLHRCAQTAISVIGTVRMTRRLF